MAQEIINNEIAYVKDFHSETIRASDSYPGGILINDYKVKDYAELHIAFQLESNDTQAEIRVYVDYSDDKGRIPKDRPRGLLSDGRNFFKLVKAPPANKLVSFRLIIPNQASTVNLKFCKEGGSTKISEKIYISPVKAGISIITPVYKEEKLIGRLLSSIEKQTAKKENFEIIFIINGERDNSERILEKWRADNPEINCKIVYEDKASASNARNAGAKYIGFSHSTYVDADDALSPGFIDSFLERLAPSQAPVSYITDFFEDGAINHDTQLNSEIKKALESKRPVAPWEIHAIATMSACKGIPSWFIRCTSFDTSLASGEDVVFFCDLYNKFPYLLFEITSSSNQCTYYRSVRPNSVSRRAGLYEFSVIERINVMSSLKKILKEAKDPEAQELTKMKINSSAIFIYNYLKKNPEQFKQYVRDAQAKNIEDFPWQYIARRSTETLCILDNLSSQPDEAAQHFSKQILTWGQSVDVSTDYSIRNRLTKLESLTPYIGAYTTVDKPAQTWEGLLHYINQSIFRINKSQTKRTEPYKNIYSFTKSYASHLTAAILKIQNPLLYWIVEVPSNQSKLNISIPIKWLEEEGILKALSELNIQPDLSNTNIEYWSNLITSKLADKLISPREEDADPIQTQPVETLAILHCFPPDSDASSIVASKRISAWTMPCDVISNDMSKVRHQDNELLELVSPYLNRVSRLNTPVSFAGWNYIVLFIEAAFKEAESFQRERNKPYKYLYSRARWSASNYTAALDLFRNLNYQAHSYKFLLSS